MAPTDAPMPMPAFAPVDSWPDGSVAESLGGCVCVCVASSLGAVGVPLSWLVVADGESSSDMVDVVDAAEVVEVANVLAEAVVVELSRVLVDAVRGVTTLYALVVTHSAQVKGGDAPSVSRLFDSQQFGG